MTTSLATRARPTGPARRRVRLALVTVALLVAGVIVTAAWTLHYAHAAPLAYQAGSSGWTASDARETVSTGSGPDLVAEVRRNQDQTFQFSIRNLSSVTQTVLGLTYPSALTSEPDHLDVSTSRVPNPDRTTAGARFARGAVDVPPGARRLVRYTVRITNCWSSGRSETWASLELHVRTGAFTRDETITFGRGTAFVLQADHATC